MKRKENSALRNSGKKLTNHSSRKTLSKKMRQNYIPKSEIIGSTDRNSEAGLDAYDSGNEEQQRVIFNDIDVNKDPVHLQRSHSKSWVILPNDERVKNPTFNFLAQKWASPKSTNYHFHHCTHCTVNFYNGENSVQHQNHNRKRKKCVVPLILLMNNNFSIFRGVEYCVCY